MASYSRRSPTPEERSRPATQDRPPSSDSTTKAVHAFSLKSKIKPRLLKSDGTPMIQFGEDPLVKWAATFQTLFSMCLTIVAWRKPKTNSDRSLEQQATSVPPPINPYSWIPQWSRNISSPPGSPPAFPVPNTGSPSTEPPPEKLGLDGMLLMIITVCHLPLETCAPISIAGRDDVPRWIRLCQYELLWNPRLFGD
ncbi:hypothetical protein PHLCEN_2v2595 [Hermanssonia centrifuga]|uniref:Uncharacterized protein n=1 Tax=Hermanssonia centrifuga TaxID=98765 RepID=A0A2R6RLH5_9APHY|nr:hypothetical protein PHLCEN_2v2595 [Hermanssonia centrifuga]